LEEKNSGFGLENREYGRRDPGSLYPQNLSLTSPTSEGRLIGTVSSRAQTTDFLSAYESILCRFCLVVFSLRRADARKYVI
jgi:hypothetical protein